MRHLGNMTFQREANGDYERYKRQRNYADKFDWDFSCIFGKVCTRSGKLKNVHVVVVTYLMASTILGLLSFAPTITKLLPEEIKEYLGTVISEDCKNFIQDAVHFLDGHANFAVGEMALAAFSPLTILALESYPVDKALGISYVGTVTVGMFLTAVEAKINAIVSNSDITQHFLIASRKFEFLGIFLLAFLLMRIFKAYFLMCGFDLYHQLKGE